MKIIEILLVLLMAPFVTIGFISSLIWRGLKVGFTIFNDVLRTVNQHELKENKVKTLDARKFHSLVKISFPYAKYCSASITWNGYDYCETAPIGIDGEKQAITLLLAQLIKLGILVPESESKPPK